ncbi:MAG: flagellar motor switch protein FliN [Dactylosporangium sp.]|nr:flagellar motor switch protein FliN [Dactylosporangium sp.]NNJ61284.1 flagellar motor switch protein FliN [Dactylosporangium sp.]
MTPATVETQPAQAVAAATAAAAFLPASSPLTIGIPISDAADAADIVFDGKAILARFSGSAHGEVAVIVREDLIEALSNTPMGVLDLSQAVRPALEAAATSLGPVVVDPGQVGDPGETMAEMLTGGGLIVPLLAEGVPHAALGFCVTAWLTGPRAADPAKVTGQRPGLDLLHDVEMEVTAELGRTKMPVRDLLSLLPGAVVELDRAAGGPVDLLVNGRMIAHGEVVVIDENYGIRITEIIPPADRD